MRILVDADACPVKRIIEQVAVEQVIEVIMYIDSSHELESEYSKVIIVDKAMDSVDLAILKELKPQDVVVTQDYGLAALVLNKKGLAINQNGMVFTENNIDELLFKRFLGKELRRTGKRTKNIKKRSNTDDFLFEESFRELVAKLL